MPGRADEPDRRSVLALGLAAALAPGIGVERAAATPAEAPLPLDEVAPGIHVFRAPYELLAPSNAGAIANMSLVVGDEAALVIDTGNSVIAGRRLLAAVKAVTDKPLRYIVNTHMHPDHVLGNAAFSGVDARFVGHRKLPRALSMRAETYIEQLRRTMGDAVAAQSGVIIPDLLVEDRLELDLGNRRLVLEAQPTAHTDNDLTIRDTATDTWFLGDLLFMGHVPTLDGSLNGWLALIDRLVALKAARVVPGHGPASAPWPGAIASETAYLAELRAEVRAFVARGGSMAEAGETLTGGRGNWALFDDFNARNVIAAYHELEWE
ncbi:quinoprotein relay system zinc metallohydrolase 2 [Ancylobacter terrae]|uniref:quinoprotein relay system zinc metallohydrolase 2 n=1 Tax=Ancylobacter sp. sgz301288 TaxID=3342077 RepID=UPI00385F9BEF